MTVLRQGGTPIPAFSAARGGIRRMPPREFTCPLCGDVVPCDSDSVARTHLYSNATYTFFSCVGCAATSLCPANLHGIHHRTQSLVIDEDGLLVGACIACSAPLAHDGRAWGDYYGPTAWEEFHRALVQMRAGLRSMTP